MLTVKLLDTDEFFKWSMSNNKGFIIDTDIDYEQGFRDISELIRKPSVISMKYGPSVNDPKSNFYESYSCECGETLGIERKGMLCPDCFSEITLRDKPLTYVGWMILPECIKLMSREGKQLIGSLIGHTRLKEVLEGKNKRFPHVHAGNFYNYYEDVLTALKKTDTSFMKKLVSSHGDGIHHERLTKIFKQKNVPDTKLKNLITNKDKIFSNKIPVIHKKLRDFFIQRNWGVDELQPDKLTTKYIQMSKIIKILKEYSISETHVREGLLQIYTLQKEASDKTIETIAGDKHKLVRAAIASYRAPYTARSVLGTYLTNDIRHCSMNYDAFRTIYRIDIHDYLLDKIAYKNVSDILNINLELTDANRLILDDVLNAKLDWYIPINRQPTLYEGSTFVLEVVELTNDLKLAIPISVLPVSNADIDGDVLTQNYTPRSIRKQVYELLGVERMTVDIFRKPHPFGVTLVKDQMVMCCKLTEGVDMYVTA